MSITLVKKIKLDGSPCRKCADVLERLERDGYMEAIDRIVVADERNPESEGMQLAAKFEVERAPFFLVSDADGGTRVYTVYLKFLKEVLRVRTNEQAEAQEILEQNSDLDFL